MNASATTAQSAPCAGCGFGDRYALPGRNRLNRPIGAITFTKSTETAVKDLKPIARRPHNAPPTRDTGPRVNERIREDQIRLIGPEGENIGLSTPAYGMQLAAEAGLDLVEISPNASPPVCKVMDFGKFKYEQQKRESEARKKQKIIDVKEIKFRPNTDSHDYDVKLRNIVKFLENGDKVKATMRFRGREMAHQNLGLELLQRVAKDVEEIGKVENMPRLEGRQMVMMIGPVSR